MAARVVLPTPPLLIDKRDYGPHSFPPAGVDFRDWRAFDKDRVTVDSRDIGHENEHLHLIPAHPNLAALEVELGAEVGREMILHNALSEFLAESEVHLWVEVDGEDPPTLAGPVGPAIGG